MSIIYNSLFIAAITINTDTDTDSGSSDFETSIQTRTTDIISKSGFISDATARYPHQHGFIIAFCPSFEWDEPYFE